MGLTLRAMTDAECRKKLREELREFGLLKAVTDRLDEIMAEIRPETSYPVYCGCMEKCEEIYALLEMEGKYKMPGRNQF